MELDNQGVAFGVALALGGKKTRVWDTDGFLETHFWRTGKRRAEESGKGADASNSLGS